MRRQWATVACVLVSLTATGAGVAAPDTDLPQIPQILRAGQACTPPSGRTIADVPWQLPALGAQRVWPLANGAGVTVAVIDTGVDQTAVPSDVVADGGEDCVGHGTVVASLIAAPVKEGVGVAGLAPGARIMAVRGTDRSGGATPASIAGGIDAAVAAGARVLCVAAVTPTDDPVLGQAAERAVAAGAVVIAAAGPDITSAGSGPAGPYYPAAYPGVVSVTAVGPDGTGDVRSGIKPAAGSLAAPGILVVGTGPGGGQVVGVGPAFAAAHVAAAAALVRSYLPRASASEIVQRLRRTSFTAGDGRVIDPLAAMTAVAAVDHTAPPSRDALVVAPAPDLVPARTAAWAVTGTVVLVMCLIAAAAAVVPRGRRRGWRAGTLPSEVSAAADTSPVAREDAPPDVAPGGAPPHTRTEARTDDTRHIEPAETVPAVLVEFHRQWDERLACDAAVLARTPAPLLDVVRECFGRLVAPSSAALAPHVFGELRRMLLDRMAAEYLAAAETSGTAAPASPERFVALLGTAWDTTEAMRADVDQARGVTDRSAVLAEIREALVVWQAVGLAEADLYGWMGSAGTGADRLAAVRAWIDEWLDYDELGDEQLPLVMTIRDAAVAMVLKGGRQDDVRVRALWLLTTVLHAKGRHCLPWVCLRHGLADLRDPLAERLTELTERYLGADVRGLV